MHTQFYNDHALRFNAMLKWKILHRHTYGSSYIPWLRECNKWDIWLLCTSLWRQNNLLSSHPNPHLEYWHTHLLSSRSFIERQRAAAAICEGRYCTMSYSTMVNSIRYLASVCLLASTCKVFFAVNNFSKSSTTEPNYFILLGLQY